MLYIKLFLVFLWLCLTSVIGLFYVVLKWGDYDLNRDFAHLFSWGALRILGIQLEVEGREHLESHQPCIYIANHQSGLDVVNFGQIYPRRTIVIGKKEVLWVPMFGIFFVAARNIMINRKNSVQAVAGLAKAVETIRRDQVSIWIFPEGTRNRENDSLLPFKRGPFHMALQAGIPLVPIVCGSIQGFANWKERRLGRGVAKIRILPPIDVRGYTEKDIDLLVNLARNQMVEAFQSLSR